MAEKDHELPKIEIKDIKSNQEEIPTTSRAEETPTGREAAGDTKLDSYSQSQPQGAGDTSDSTQQLPKDPFSSPQDSQNAPEQPSRPATEQSNLEGAQGQGSVSDGPGAGTGGNNQPLPPLPDTVPESKGAHSQDNGEPTSTTPEENDTGAESSDKAVDDKNLEGKQELPDQNSEGKAPSPESPQSKEPTGDKGAGTPQTNAQPKESSPSPSQKTEGGQSAQNIDKPSPKSPEVQKAAKEPRKPLPEAPTGKPSGVTGGAAGEGGANPVSGLGKDMISNKISSAAGNNETVAQAQRLAKASKKLAAMGKKVVTAAKTMGSAAIAAASNPVTWIVIGGIVAITYAYATSIIIGKDDCLEDVGGSPGDMVWPGNDAPVEEKIEAIGCWLTNNPISSNGNKPMSTTQAGAVLGIMLAETGSLQPDLIQDGGGPGPDASNQQMLTFVKGHSEGSRGAVGLFQHRSGRAQRMVEMAIEQGKEWNDPNVQMEHFIEEISEGGPEADKLKANGFWDPGQSSEMYSHIFNRFYTRSCRQHIDSDKTGCSESYNVNWREAGKRTVEKGKDAEKIIKSANCASKQRGTAKKAGGGGDPDSNPIIKVAKEQLGKPYVWAANGPNSFDCSGLVYYAYHHGAGYEMGEITAFTDTQIQYGRDEGEEVYDGLCDNLPLDELQAGDIIGFDDNTDPNSKAYRHVGLFYAGDEMIHAPRPGKNVEYSKPGEYYNGQKCTVVRLLDSFPDSGGDICLPPDESVDYGEWTVPTCGPITSPFGMRIHPVLGYPMFHSGLDFGAPGGTDILASKGGIVTKVVTDPTCGNMVIIEHEDVDMSTRYCHIMPNGFEVKEGDKVSAGDVIAKVGTTGRSTGNHLHFEIMEGLEGEPQDPAEILEDAGHSLDDNPC